MTATRVNLKQMIAELIDTSVQEVLRSVIEEYSEKAKEAALVKLRSMISHFAVDVRQAIRMADFGDKLIIELVYPNKEEKS